MAAISRKKTKEKTPSFLEYCPCNATNSGGMYQLQSSQKSPYESSTRPQNLGISILHLPRNLQQTHNHNLFPHVSKNFHNNPPLKPGLT